MILSLTVRCTNTVCQNALQLMAIVAYTTGFSVLVLKNNHPSEVVNIILHVTKDAASFWGSPALINADTAELAL